MALQVPNVMDEAVTRDEPYRSFFKGDRRLVQASAPGRMDVMGGIADYSGSLLMQKTIREMTTVTIGLRDDGILRVCSLSADIDRSENTFEMPIRKFYKNGQLKEYPVIRSEIKRLKGGDWALYVIGCFFQLTKLRGIDSTGADILVESDIPIGKGVSSSAALEIAVLMALNRLYGLKLGKISLPILAQQVENRVVGAPCGLMDQLTSYLGRSNTLLPIICQPAKVFPVMEIPEGVCFAGIDSGVRHAVSGSSYINVRTAAFMGYTVIAGYLGKSYEDIYQARVSGQWKQLPFGGYLANIGVDEFENRFRTLLPEWMTGSEFLEKYRAVIDPFTLPVPDENYAVRNCTAHPVYENRRVALFKKIISGFIAGEYADRHTAFQQLGDLMYESHKAYTLCGLGNKRTDELVEIFMESGNEWDIFGAKITGGGSGGTVCILCDGEQGLSKAREIGEQYARKYDIPLVLFEGDIDGGYYN